MPDDLNELLKGRDSAFWTLLRERTETSEDASELLHLARLRRQAERLGMQRDSVGHRRIAIVGGYTLFPLSALLAHLLAVEGLGSEVKTGAYDQYVQELMDQSSYLSSFQPDHVWLLPSHTRCRYTGTLLDSPELVRMAAKAQVEDVLDLCRLAHERSRDMVILSNFVPPAEVGLGAFRSRTLATPWAFCRLVNQTLGERAPSYVKICDVEFIACRRGLSWCHDAQAWFETKQPCSADFLVSMAREAAFLVKSCGQPSRKVLVLDLDNTLWGGEVGEVGAAGLEFGYGSPRGEAFLEFQRYVRSLKDRGVLLAVVSKNDPEIAREPFRTIPDMILRIDDFVRFKASWNQKSESLAEMARELRLGLDSFVFVDDNPAEIGLVRQFAPMVRSVCLGPDPSRFPEELDSMRFFEPHTISSDDLQRSHSYRSEEQRKNLRSSIASLDEYLEALGMELVLDEYRLEDLGRICQLLNKSNQFNLTTRRRSEAELTTWLQQPGRRLISGRLTDRFGQYGLITVVLLEERDGALAVDSWVMSCRALGRRVEEELLHELVRLADRLGIDRIEGLYIRTDKNGLVHDLFPRLGFNRLPKADNVFVLEVASFRAKNTSIHVRRRCDDNVRCAAG